MNIDKANVEVAVTAAELGRPFVGIEIEPRFFDVPCRRFCTRIQRCVTTGAAWMRCSTRGRSRDRLSDTGTDDAAPRDGCFMTEVACCCEEWRVNLPKINKPIILQTVRSGGQYQFDGAPFRYCPWCGKQLRGVERVVP